MKNSVKLAFCGIFTALASVFMAASLIPDMTFAIPAIAGLFIIPVFIEAGTPRAILCFVASAVLSFFIGDKTSWILYIALFGYYPILKPYIEKAEAKILKWVFKILLFNTAAIACYAAEVLLFGITLKGWILCALFALGNIAFVLYDIAISRIAALYYLKLHDRISSMLGK